MMRSQAASVGTIPPPPPGERANRTTRPVGSCVILAEYAGSRPGPEHLARGIDLATSHDHLADRASRLGGEVARAAPMMGRSDGSFPGTSRGPGMRFRHRIPPHACSTTSPCLDVLHASPGACRAIR